MSCEIRLVRYSNPTFAGLIEDADADGARFMARLRDHWIDGSERFDRPGEILLGAFVENELAGVGGISHEPYEPEDGLGRVRHVYVLTKYRRRGIARALVHDLIGHARKHFSLLRLHTPSPAAARLYEDLGFRPSGQGRETHRLELQTSSTNLP